MSHHRPVFEHALLQVRPGEESAFEAAMGQAVTYLARRPGYVGHSVTRQLEDAGVYLLLHEFYDPFPTVTHFGATSVSESLPVL